MEIEEFAKKLNLKYTGTYSEEEKSYVIDLPNSNVYGDVYIKLENNNLVDLLEDNQVITEEGSSLTYEAVNEPFIISLLADWSSDQYQVVITEIK